jgi:hypothetical protein
MVVAEAAAAVGVSITVAWEWFRHGGGVMPQPRPAGQDRSGVHRLSFQEREEISRRLPLVFPDDPAMRVSHETIYRCLYVHGRGGLQRELVKCLRTGRSLRKDASHH